MDALGPSGQRVLPGLPGQLGLDGRVYDFRPGRATTTNPAPRPHPLERLPDLHSQRVSKRDRYSIAFDFGRDLERDGPCARCASTGEHCEHGVGYQLTFDEWKRATADALEWLNPHDPKRAERFRQCGEKIVAKQCKECGSLDTENAAQSSDCESRVCPSCARPNSLERRAEVSAALRAWPIQRRGFTPMHLVLTVKRDRGTSVYSLQEGLSDVLAGWKAVWTYLSERGLAARAYVKPEVGLGGNVHAHCLVWMPFLTKRQLSEVRDVYEKATGSIWFHLQRIRGGKDLKKAIAEVSKYTTKGVVPGGDTSRRGEQTSPVLAAMVDTAWKGKHLWREYGDFDSLPVELPDAERWECGSCGSCDSRSVYFDRNDFRRLRGSRAPPPALN